MKGLFFFNLYFSILSNFSITDFDKSISHHTFYIPINYLTKEGIISLFLEAIYNKLNFNNLKTMRIDYKQLKLQDQRF